MDRIAAAQDRMFRLRRELTAGLPCVGCRHLRFGNCRHPAIQDYSKDVVSGSITPIPIPAADARSEDGGCGPHAELYDPQPSWQAGVVGAAIGLKNAWMIAAGIFFVGFWITDLLL